MIILQLCNMRDFFLFIIYFCFAFIKIIINAMNIFA